MCVVTILGIIICYYLFCLHNKCYNLFKRNTVHDPNTSKPDPQQELQNTTLDTVQEPVAAERNVIFTSNSIILQSNSAHRPNSICRNSFITNVELAILTFHNRHVILNTSWNSTRQTEARLKETFKTELSRYATYHVKLGYYDTSFVHLVHVLNVYILFSYV